MSSKKLRACTDFSPFSSIDDLPEEILIGNIFLKLPASALVQCRCVCNQWLRILTDPKFIRMHFKHQETNKKLLFGPSYRTNLPPDHSLVCYRLQKSVTREGVFFSVDVQGSAAHAVRLPGFKPPTEYELMRTLGHANGIVCMAVRRKDITWETYLDSWHLLFGNPSTGYYRILSEKLNFGNLIVGFIYDSSCDDFKFVQVTVGSGLPYIYSLKSNSWRTVVGESDDLGIRSNYTVGRKEQDPENIGCALGNSIYWVMEIYSLVVRFDLEDEKFKEMPFPVDFRKGKNRISIKVVEDVLYAVNVCQNNGAVDVDMWSLSKEERWIKLTTLTFSYEEFGRYFDFYPVHVIKDEKKILCCVEYFTDSSCIRLDKRKHLLVNPETNMFEDYLVKGISSNWLENCTFEVQHSSYVDSLLLPALLD